MRRKKVDLRIPTEEQLKQVSAYADKVVKRMLREREIKQGR